MVLGILEIAAMAFSATTIPQQGGSERPLQMRVDEDGSSTVVKLIGAAPSACSASYDLEVTQNGNRSVQRGVAQLRAGTGETTIATVRLPPRPLSARLIVKPCGSGEYEEVFVTPAR